jgi:hypothetical protein
MPQRIIHHFGNVACESILEAYGIVTKDQKTNPLEYKQCPNCYEPNKPDSKYCVNCQLVLSYDAYSETLKTQKEKENDLNSLKQLVETYNFIKRKAMIDQTL